MKEFTKMIDLFVLSGGIGFINYFILTKKGTLNIKKDNKEDKTLFILFFSVVNMAIYHLLLSFSPVLKKAIMRVEFLGFIDNIYFYRAIAIIATLGISIFMSLYIYPMSAKVINNKINKTRIDNEGKTLVNQYPPRTMTLDKNQRIEAFIFSLSKSDGERQYIANGFIDTWSDNIDDRKQLTLYPRTNDYKTKIFTENEVLEIINNEEIPDNSTRIYIDKDLDMIFYLIYYT